MLQRFNRAGSLKLVSSFSGGVPLTWFQVFLQICKKRPHVDKFVMLSSYCKKMKTCLFYVSQFVLAFMLGLQRSKQGVALRFIEKRC